MSKFIIKAALAATAAAMPAIATAQPGAGLPSGGVRLDVVGTGEVRRAPDQVLISSGVTTRSAQAEAALRENAEQMTRVRAALVRAGIAARDIQTGSISLSQDYRPDPAGSGEMRPSGFVANNSVTIRFRDVARAGRIIDALVAAGANNVNGPSFELSTRGEALDEARMLAVSAARRRAEAYARTLGTRVVRIVAVSEANPGGNVVMEGFAANRAQSADTRIEPGELGISANVTVTFELEQPSR